MRFLFVLGAVVLLTGCEEALPKTERMQDEPVRRAATSGTGLIDRPLDPAGEPPGH
jgi:hypothetical protein